MLGSFSKEAKAEEDFSQVLDRDLSKKEIKRLNPKTFTHSFITRNSNLIQLIPISKTNYPKLKIFNVSLI